jgi:hypothetical protein
MAIPYMHAQTMAAISLIPKAKRLTIAGLFHILQGKSNVFGITNSADQWKGQSSNISVT